jgi:hypothetical protein
VTYACWSLFYIHFLIEVKLFDLCERAFLSRLTLREEGQVELWVETPNGLSASAILLAAERRCQYWILRNVT